jgi:hypothetical protein
MIFHSSNIALIIRADDVIIVVALLDFQARNLFAIGVTEEAIALS